METPNLQTSSFYIDKWLVEPAFNRISSENKETLLQPKMMKVLVCLAESAGRPVTYDVLITRGWKDAEVRDNVLHRTISHLRKALADETTRASFIKTIPKQGYCLTAQIRFYQENPIAKPAPTTPPQRQENTAQTVNQNSFSTLLLHKAQQPYSWLFSISVFCVIILVVFLFSPTEPADKITALPRLFTSMKGVELHPSFSPDGNYLAYVWVSPNDNADVYIQATDDEIPRQLTNTPRFEYQPAWSPDGTHIAYYSFSRSDLSDCWIQFQPVAEGDAVRKEDIVKVAPCNKSRQRKLAWSPDKKWLAFEELDLHTNQWRIHLLSLETGKTHPATSPDTSNFQEQNFAFSRDGQSLLYYRRDPTSTESIGDLFMTPVSDTPQAPQQITHGFGYIYDFGWAYEPDELFFFSLRDEKRGIWHMPTDTYEPEIVITVPEIIGGLAVSPTGDHLAYVAWEYEENIWRASLADGDIEMINQSAIIHSTRRDVSPQISPSGRHIAFISNRTGFYELWVSDYNGQKQIKLTNMNSMVRGPRWSPDGKHIAVYALQDGQIDIFVIDATTGEQQQLTHHGADDFLPAWSQDGQSIFFSSARTGGYQIWKTDLAGSSLTQVTKHGGTASFEAPDGRSLFFSKNAVKGIWQLDYQTQKIAQVTDQLHFHDHQSWTVTKEALYFIKRADQSPAMLMRYDLQSKEIIPVKRIERDLYLGEEGLGLTISPNELWMAYGRVDVQSSDLMIVDTQ